LKAISIFPATNELDKRKGKKKTNSNENKKKSNHSYIYLFNIKKENINSIIMIGVDCEIQVFEFGVCLGKERSEYQWFSL